ncbi:DUF2484 family protein [Actibacterium sp.]|uniref:DUF2484 family protein n=1 Tax=Actibacterium sp. TaxID=1872125 RepID=UPI0035625511
MSAGLILACLWVLLASAAGASRGALSWKLAYGLIALALPLLIYIAVKDGVIWALVFLVAAGSILRWPLIYLGRWCRRKLRGKPPVS